MVFSSIEFLLFFLPFYMVLYGITPKAYRNVALLVGSLVFYAYGELRYLGLLCGSVAVNYFVGLHLAKAKRESTHRHRNRTRTILFAGAAIGNIGLLVFFKGMSGKLGLPLGISFYTFQILSYLTDVYRGDVAAERSWVKLAVYVTMFPQLIAGPIVNYEEVAAQLSDREYTSEGIQDGLKVFILGLASKVLLADRIGLLWQEVQVTGFESISTPLAWLAAFGYSLEIYFDFYGYSLMAVGLGRMLGFRLPENFRTPYMARSVREFYRRWHMTLERWFRRYVYIPLGGSRRGELRTVRNLAAVWVLTAAWHGKTWNFLVWGGSLCVLIILERQAGRLNWTKDLRILPHLYLWLVIPVTWMCFAIPDLAQLREYLGRMFGLSEGINVNVLDWRKALRSYGVLFAAAFVSCTPLVKMFYEKIKNRLAGLVLFGGLFWLCVWRLVREGENVFLYFRF
ncbi:MAG: MBOAT family protein [Clostridium sp.]|jgi:alginate O-acetyltransferase complex protein AlgI|nr:MBOAT family protein [Clostridium sp.]